MKHHDSTTFEELQQVENVWKKGTLLGRHIENFHTLWLYMLDDTYVEITFHTHFNVLLRITYFKDTELLEPYLSEIDLSSLLV